MRGALSGRAWELVKACAKWGLDFLSRGRCPTVVFRGVGKAGAFCVLLALYSRAAEARRIK